MRKNEIYFVWGVAHKLEITESPGYSKVSQANNILKLKVPPGTTKVKKQQVLDKFYQRLIKEAAPELVKKWERITGIKITKIYYRKMKTHWGSCNSKKRSIRLNTELAKKPTVCLDFVIIHEILHVIERHHNQRFYSLMNKFFPDWKSVRQSMR